MITNEFSECTWCPLHRGASKVCMPYKGADSPKLLFIGDCPSLEDDAKGDIFSGRSGAVLKDALDYLKIPIAEVGFDNVIKCSPIVIDPRFLEATTPPTIKELMNLPDHEFIDLVKYAPYETKIKAPITDEHLHHCKPFIRANIASLNPEAIVLLGNDAMSYLLGMTGITKKRGNLYYLDLGVSFGNKKIPVIPTFNPKALLYASSAGQVLSSSIFARHISNSTLEGFIADLDKAWKLAIGEYKVSSTITNLIIGDYNGVQFEPIPNSEDFKRTTIDKGLKDLCDRLKALPEGAYIALDTETEGLRPYAPIAQLHCISLSIIEGEGFVLPWAHPEWLQKCSTNGYTPIWDSVYWQEFKDLLHSGKYKIIFHNAKFDIHWLRRFAGINVKPSFDSYLAAHALYTKTMPLNLKFLSTRFCQMETYEAKKDAFLASLSPVDRLFSKLPFEDIIVPYAGGDTDATIRLTKFLDAKLLLDPLVAKHYYELTLPLIYYVSKMEEYGVFVDKESFTAVGDSLDEDMKNFYSWLMIIPEVQALLGDKHTLRLSADSDLRILLFDYMKLPIQERTKKGAPSVKKEVMTNLKTYCQQNITPETSYYGDVLAAISSWRKLKKLRSTYVDGIDKFIEYDYIHTNYNQAGTDTGRWSANAPSVHTIPWHSMVKRPFITRWMPYGGIFLQTDYSQNEVRILASEANELGLIQAYARGEDIHTYVASEIFFKDKSEVKSDERRHAKLATFCYMYGGGAETLAVIANISLDKAKIIMAKFAERFPAIAAYMAKQHAFVDTHGCIYSPLGRKRMLPHSNNKREMNRARRQAINTPIQSAGSDLTASAILEEMQWIEFVNYKSLLWGFTHDSTTADIYPMELESMMDLNQFAMVDRAAAKFEWLNIKLVADMEIGVTWHGLCEIKNYDRELRKFDLKGYQDPINLIHTNDTFTKQGVRILGQSEGKLDDKPCIILNCEFFNDKVEYPWRQKLIA